MGDLKIPYPNSYEELLENKSTVYKKFDNIITNYWEEVKTKGKNFVNVWIYYEMCKKTCGLHKFELPNYLHLEYLKFLQVG